MNGIEGRVIQRSRRAVRVDCEGNTYTCSLRGKFRDTRSQDGTTSAPVVVGDRVIITAVAAEQGVVEDVLPRQSELTRVTAGGKTVTVAANLDQALLVLSARDPDPRWSLVDRVFAAAGRQELEVALALNKWDRLDSEEMAAIVERLDFYEHLGYRTFRVSALSGEGIDGLVDWLRGRLTVLTGHSGVGKSTLLNALHPSLKLVTRSVSERSGKGRHTTTAVTLYSMPFGGYVADTPGFREFALSGLQPREVGLYFVDFAEFLSRCRFKDCLHDHEPDCAVRLAVDQGEISKFRYESYLRILAALRPE